VHLAEPFRRFYRPFSGFRLFQARAFSSAPVQAIPASSLSQETANVPYTPNIWQKLFGRSSMPRVPLDQLFPGSLSPVDAKAPSAEAKISTLSSGLRIATIDSNSAVAHIGVFIDTGSRYETREVSGISHFLERIAFKGTTSRTDFRFYRDMSQIGTNVHCAASREHVVLSADALRPNIPEVLAALADVLQRPRFAEFDLREARAQYAAEAEGRSQAPDILLQDLLHEAAYQNNTLGNSFFAPLQNLDHFTGDVLRGWVREHYTTDRIVVSAVGVDHKEFTDLVTKVFNELPRSLKPHKSPQAQYTGGELRSHHKGDKKDAFTHVALAFEAGSWHDKDLIPLCVLQLLMGGGGSFSAGGPGKGMYSRLYQNVLNVHGWIETAQTLAHIYSDSGIFGFYGKTAPQNASDLMQVLLEEAQKMAGPVADVELTRAKNALKSSVYMQLESRQLQVEDTARQLMTFGKVTTPQQLANQIDSVSGHDIVRVAKRLLKTVPTIAAVGDLGYLPRYDAIAQVVKSLTK